jgi:hypothetical protein
VTVSGGVGGRGWLVAGGAEEAVLAGRFLADGLRGGFTTTEERHDEVVGELLCKWYKCCSWL